MNNNNNNKNKNNANDFEWKFVKRHVKLTHFKKRRKYWKKFSDMWDKISQMLNAIMLMERSVDFMLTYPQLTSECVKAQREKKVF